ncbi:MAG: class I SAM-dependent methyltransferase, partial [Bacilli bacterium]|nr:class I SAM-dependent methyltransferase [Bacilli bacterium]
IMDSSKEIKERYASEAETYRRDAWLINFDAEELFAEFRRIVRQLFPDNLAKLKILDVGAGNGMLTELILSEFPNAIVTMLDFSAEMLESAQAIFETKAIPLDRINFLVKNFITDDFPDEKYDLIISSYALHHIREIDELKSVYLKISNSLKKDGTFLCLDNYLETDEFHRNNQIKIAFEKWTENYNSEEIAKEWANIIKGEDSPATIPLIITSLNECNKNNVNVIPFLSSKKGTMAIIYGITKLDSKQLREVELIDLVDETKKYIGKEELIDSYPFDSYL